MTKNRHSGFCLIAAVSIFLFSANASPAELKLSLDSARHYAIEHNRNLVNAGLSVDEAGVRLREVIAQGLPQINASVDYSNFFGSTATLGSMPGFVIEFNPTSNLSLSVGQLLFSGSYIVGIQMARLYRDITETSLEKTSLDIRAQVTQAYYLVLVSDESRSVIGANLDNMNDVLKRTRAMVDAGIMEDLDYDQLTVQAGMLGNALKAADRQVELALNMLRLQMGIDSEVEMVLTDSLEGIVSSTDFRGGLVDPLAVNANLDYQLMELQTDIAGKQVDMERASYLPTLNGFYNYTEKLLKPEFDITPKHVVGLNLSIPIFSSGMRHARVNQARINLKIAENQKELLSEQLLIQEKQLRYNLNNAIDQYEAQKSNVEVAKRVYENIQLRYRQGMISSLDLTTAGNNYLQAENGYISALMQLLDANVAMDRMLNRNL